MFLVSGAVYVKLRPQRQVQVGRRPGEQLHLQRRKLAAASAAGASQLHCSAQTVTFRSEESTGVKGHKVTTPHCVRVERVTCSEELLLLRDLPAQL